MDKPPKISVIMPVFNVEEYVEQAIESILDQTFSDFELLIMDDGSTDETLSLLKAASQKDQRIRVFDRPNRKVAACLNELVQLSKADIIARMDGDDIARPERFAKQFQFLQDNPNTAVVGSWVKTFSDKAETWHFRRWDNYSRNLLCFGVTILSHPTWMLKKSLLERYPYDDSYRTIIDREWLARVAISEPDLKFISLPEVLLDYRVHPGSVTGLHLERQKQLTQPVVIEYLKSYGVVLNEYETHLWMKVVLNQSTNLEECKAVGELFERIQLTVKDTLEDNFYVFREKWLHFCLVSGWIEIKDDYVAEENYKFMNEKS